MRIVIDMQGAQTESRFRGIGRYTLSFVQAIVRNRGDHEIFLALNGLFPDTIEPIRAAFDDILPQENIRVWYSPGPVKEEDPYNSKRRAVAEIARESFLDSLQPDIIHISSLFEGYVDDAVTSVKLFSRETPVSAVLYDLIPLLNAKQYLNPYPLYSSYYAGKIQHLKNVDLCFAISAYSRQEGIDSLAIDPDRVVNISTAVGPEFTPIKISEAEARTLKHKLGLTRPFVLYTGGADERKNLARLIEAWSRLPQALRQTHQLLLAGKMPEGNVSELRSMAKRQNLTDHELLFSGYVDDQELVQLYNLCKLFVFPSWHEGFGLPALEAMACGAPVIASNTTSLPEVVGREDALFNPFNVEAISQKIRFSLEDEDFREALRSHALSRAGNFSWDKIGRFVLDEWSKCALKPHTRTHTSPSEKISCRYQRLINAISAISDVSGHMSLMKLSADLAHNEAFGIERQLLIDVSELCQRDAGTGVQRVVRSYLGELLRKPPRGFQVLPVYATLTSGYRYAFNYMARILNCPSPGIEDTEMKWQRDDIFFGLDMQHHVQLARAGDYSRLRQDGVIVKFLVHDLLPIQLPEFFKEGDAKLLHEQWLRMIAVQDGAICVSMATADAYKQWLATEGIEVAPGFSIDWVHSGANIEQTSLTHDLSSDVLNFIRHIRARPTFLVVSTLEPRKAQSQVLEAAEQLWAKDTELNLVFVGRQGWKVDALVNRIQTHPENGKRLFWLNGIDDEYLRTVYEASACLIAPSVNEGFGLPLIEAASYGLPIIARDIPVFREVAGESAYYFTGESGVQLSLAMQEWLALYERGEHPSSARMEWSTWQESAERLKAILVQHSNPRRQLLVDVSELMQRDSKSGIQRFVRNILREWMNSPPKEYRVEPVYATPGQPYRYAREFTQRFLGISNVREDSVIQHFPGDIFFLLDLKPEVVVDHRSYYQDLRRDGVKVLFLVYDLLPVQMPDYFSAGTYDLFSSWLAVVAENDGAICISETVSSEFSSWVNSRHFKKEKFRIAWSHCGADMDNVDADAVLTDEEQDMLRPLRPYPSFLMVGTLEPRKGHAQVLDAFDMLWDQNTDVNLIIVGKRGWLTDVLTQRILEHKELGRRLIWLEGVSDNMLEYVYAHSTCLIAASYGEGFGLPLIEAAQHKLPVMARDIPVFREVAGENAYYFVANEPEELASAVRKWLVLLGETKHPLSDKMRWLTWKESAANFMALVLDEQKSKEYHLQ